MGIGKKYKSNFVFSDSLAKMVKSVKNHSDKMG